MKKDKKTEEFLGQLRKVPIVSLACEKSGISRNSVYQWRKNDPLFSEKMEAALAEGEAFMNDMGESQLLTLMKEKSFSAVSFWLRHRHPKYKEKIELSSTISIKDDEFSPEEMKIIIHALKLADDDIQQNKKQNES